ncbi:MAG: hypothetical protein ACLRMJ_00620 [Alistipes finegoldii]
MTIFNVYSSTPVEPVRAKAARLQRRGTEYLDLYGGHAVISIGTPSPTT